MSLRISSAVGQPPRVHSLSSRLLCRVVAKILVSIGLKSNRIRCVRNRETQRERERGTDGRGKVMLGVERC